MSAKPMTKLWVMCLNDPSIDPRALSSAFSELLKEILAFCNSQSNSPHAVHQFWQDEDMTNRMVMITGWPDEASNLAADKEYVQREYLERMFKFVESRTLVQIGVSVHDLPLDADVVGIHLVKCQCESEEGCRSVEGCSTGGHQLDAAVTHAKREGKNVLSTEGVEIGKGGVRTRIWVVLIADPNQNSTEISDTLAEAYEKMNLKKLIE